MTLNRRDFIKALSVLGITSAAEIVIPFDFCPSPDWRAALEEQIALYFSQGDIGLEQALEAFHRLREVDDRSPEGESLRRLVECGFV